MEWIIIIVLIFAIVVSISYRTTHRKYDGKIIVMQQDEKKVYSLEVDCDVDDIVNRNVLIFKVVKDQIAD